MTVAPRFDQAVLAAVTEGLPADLLITDPPGLEPYSRDWSGDHYGTPLAVARPRSPAELATLMARCSALRLPVVPQGGLTGLVGAAVAEPGRELVISLERMAAVRSVDPVGFAMVVEAGCVLEVAKRAAADADCLLPITFGAQGSCRIGGNVATNAGGFNVLRYGMTRDLVLGLEVVLADGRVWNGLRTLRKDNRGYDLKQLFIGAEGTLGIVTAAALKLFPKPTKVEVALVGLNSVADVMSFFAHARRACGDLLSAFELILRPGLKVALDPPASLPDPLGAPYPAYVLMELASSGPVDLRGMLEDCLAGSDLVADGTIAASHAQAERLWLYREMMVEHQGHGGRYYRTDVSVPISRIASFLTEALAGLEMALPEAKPVAYGHVGDGNIHLNVVPPPGLSPEAVSVLFQRAEDVIFTILDRMDGSISAEHGIGRLKRHAFLDRIDPVSLAIAESVKQALDPLRILSRGRILNPTTTDDDGSGGTVSDPWH
ncbi:FAD-binding oxidoreductase [Lichenifustis flavocetrariae]|uniref:FAD-binding oxidoreductase n=1 Tax=Lichenifustis flavocetrariae TaxID=2949735 RepID=A0AA41YTU3_9HYPH|nr:FAD-binding oxidoreductase [Lichenifustis flavocetrariae]MCW6507106.1 FAD-binding oxidoreductase [Lichenifustis flavocetrariae]